MGLSGFVLSAIFVTAAAAASEFTEQTTMSEFVPELESGASKSLISKVSTLFSHRLTERSEIKAKKFCKKVKKDGKTQKCCKECKNCSVTMGKCKNGSGKCQCGGEKACKKLKADFAKKWLIENKDKVCHKQEKVCTKKNKPVTSECKKCKKVPKKVSFPCGQVCKEVEKEVKVPAQTVDCDVPGKCTKTIVERTECDNGADLDCKLEKFPKLPKTINKTFQNCKQVTKKENICAKAKVPKKTCVTVVTPDEQKCKPKGQTCKRVPDGTIKRCSIDKSQSICSDVQKKIPVNCRKEHKMRNGKCTTTMKTKTECSRGGVPMVCRDIIKTEMKCRDVMETKEDCPKKMQKVCHDTHVKVKIPGSCKTEIVPCVGYEVRQDADVAGVERSVAIHGDYSKVSECTKKAVICQYDYKVVPKCTLKSLPVKGEACKKILTMGRKCTPEQKKSKVCFRKYVDSTPADKTNSTPVISIDAGAGKCYPNNQRCAGAPGKPSVSHMPCCSKDYSCQEKSSTAGDNWGKFCLKTQSNGSPSTPVINVSTGGSGKQCYPTNHRCAGAPGKPEVKYMPCCAKGYSCQAKPSSEGNNWGKFCLKDPAIPASDEYPEVNAAWRASVRPYDFEDVKCKTVKYPDTKCEKEGYSEVKCDYNYVNEKVCTKKGPELKCEEVPKYRQECTGYGKADCTEDVKKETKCSNSFVEQQVCKDVDVKTSICSPTKVRTCQAPEFYEKRVCVPKKGAKAKCTTKKNDSTKCASATKGKCETKPSTAVVKVKQCSPKTCTRVETERKCKKEKCTKNKVVNDCVMKKVESPCIPPKATCKKPEFCTTRRVRCASSSCSAEECTPW